MINDIILHGAYKNVWLGLKSSSTRTVGLPGSWSACLFTLLLKIVAILSEEHAGTSKLEPGCKILRFRDANPLCKNKKKKPKKRFIQSSLALGTVFLPSEPRILFPLWCLIVYSDVLCFRWYFFVRAVSFHFLDGANFFRFKLHFNIVILGLVMFTVSGSLAGLFLRLHPLPICAVALSVLGISSSTHLKVCFKFSCRVLTFPNLFRAWMRRSCERVPATPNSHIWR